VVAEFEAGLAEALGTRIAPPLRGNVEVAPGNGGATLRLVVGVTAADVVEPDLGSTRAQVVPGASAPRRAVRLRCSVAVEVHGGSGDRDQQLEALDAALYALDASEFRDGSALAAPGDRGFLIHQLEPQSFAAPFAPADDERLVLKAVATGLFWPVGAEGTTGTPIGFIHIRHVVLPFEIVPDGAPLVAGGSPVTLTIRFLTSGMTITKTGTVRLPFATIAVTLLAAGGKPGAGTLSGGNAGLPGVRILPVDPVTGETAVTYTPPAKATTEELVLAFDDDEKGLGIEIGRVPLRVMP
jgi:hypothetical protein